MLWGMIVWRGRTFDFAQVRLSSANALDVSGCPISRVLCEKWVNIPTRAKLGRATRPVLAKWLD